ncbi:aldo/keto reductase [Candidatus Pelagibacter sp.]|jgi:D-threo-aldose 1-dehydrogenase|nr:aldo/keto reductase [Candidatus Pelagibacter sp.]MDA9105037.1 aldo/keto reductase [Candidatus Pelagibacter sp.]MDB4069787.1 aldo/keto reductase [Candidatus Pelagibacter sp.]
MKKNKIKDTGLEVTELSFGTSSLGSMPDTYGYEVSENRAQKTLNRFFQGPVNMLDTSRNYAMGESEKRIGKAIKENGGWPNGFLLSTKLDRNMDTLVLDKNRVRESLEESLKTLNVDSVDILFLHDPEYAKDITDITKKDGAMDELFKIKNEGLAKAAGVAMGKVDIMFPLLKNWDFDVIINHNRYTLLNREANEMYDYASSKNIAIFNAAPYAGGVLAKGPDNFKKITYQDATEEKLAPAREFEKVCKKHNVELGAAALQFSLRDNRITSTICGVTSVESIEKNLAWANTNIPEEFWNEVLKLPYSTKDPESERNFTPG